MSHYKFIPYPSKTISEEDLQFRSEKFKSEMDRRRSVRFFSESYVPKQVIENLIMTASSAPSGAHKQPWTFCAISDPEMKSNIRKAAEKEEYLNYHGRMPESWIQDLLPLGTDWKKEFITTAPWLIVMFKKSYDFTPYGKKKNYYVNESIGIAAGILIAAIHKSGLATLTHTPSPMDFLQKILKRPKNEKAYLLLPVGFPAKSATVPNLKRKSVNEVISWHTTEISQD